MDNTPLDLSKTALLLVDLQNDNVHPDGAFASFGAADHAVEQDLVPHVRQLLEWARNQSMPVIHNLIVFYPGGEFGGSNAPIFRMIGPESLKLGTWGADALEDLEARADEPVLIRNRMSSLTYALTNIAEFVTIDEVTGVAA
jgi:nicotinamidase-related amidase